MSCPQEGLTQTCADARAKVRKAEDLCHSQQLTGDGTRTQLGHGPPTRCPACPSMACQPRCNNTSCGGQDSGLEAQSGPQLHMSGVG